MDEIITLQELLKRLDKYNHKELHVHHTWRPDHETYFKKPDPLYWQQAMRNFHVNTNGWNDIGQHVTLLPDGRFVTGRPFNKNPASISGYNTGAFAVEMIGNFDKGNDRFEGKQKDSMIKLARYFDQKGRYIRFHRENASKTCPGTGIDKNEFMKEVRGKEVKGEDKLRYGKTIRKGDKGSVVKQLQQDLIALGYGKYMQPYGADGSFGAATENAVKAFQKDNKLSVDGVADPKTQAKIDELMKKNASDYKKMYDDAKKQADEYKKMYNDAKAKLDQIKKIVG